MDQILNLYIQRFKVVHYLSVRQLVTLVVFKMYTYKEITSDIGYKTNKLNKTKQNHKSRTRAADGQRVSGA